MCLWGGYLTPAFEELIKQMPVTLTSIKSWLGRFSFTLGFLALFIGWQLLDRRDPDVIYQLAGETMGTTYMVQVTGFPEGVDGDAVAQQVQELLLQVDNEWMSTYAPDSEISRFNQSEPDLWFPVSLEVAQLVQRALDLSVLTGGYFDITVGPLVNRWGFGPDQYQQGMPGADEIRALREQVGYQHVEVSLAPPQLRKHRDVQLDLSAIAKGYGADVIADYFDRLAMDSYFVEIGGELRIRGVKPDGSSWVPAIEEPTEGSSRIHRALHTDGEPLALAGSGDYRNYFEQDGQRYSHEIDPFSGRPVTHDLVAVYVVADDAATADALSTAFIVMGVDRALPLAESLGVGAYFISKQTSEAGFDIVYSTRFANYLEEAP